MKWMKMEERSGTDMDASWECRPGFAEVRCALERRDFE
jgi:hypothetical protein